MTCQQLSELLSAYLDRRLAAPPADDVTAHLETCARCRAELAELRFGARLVASLPAPRLDADLVAAVVAQAATPRWREGLATLRDWIAPRRSWFARELSRAIAIVALFLLAATARGRGPSDLVISWPGRVAGAAGAGMAQLTAGIAAAQGYLGAGGAAPAGWASAPAAPAKPAAPAHRRQRRAAPLRPSSITPPTAIAANPQAAHRPQEVTHRDIA
jgi:anti-sigma factor RsiW